MLTPACSRWPTAPRRTRCPNFRSATPRSHARRCLPPARARSRRCTCRSDPGSRFVPTCRIPRPVTQHPHDKRVLEIDFRRPSKFVREQVRRIEHAHRGYCRSASSRLAAELRTDFELHLTGTEQLPSGAVMAHMPPPAAFRTPLSLEPAGPQPLPALDLPMITRIVERMLGGGDLPFNE